MMMEPQAVIYQLKNSLSHWYQIKMSLEMHLSPTIGGLARELPNVLARFYNGTYQYTHTASFNPNVARASEIQAIETIEKPTLDRVKTLVGDLDGIIDGYAVETKHPELKIVKKMDFRTRIGTKPTP